MYQDLVCEYACRPRDVCTVPTTKVEPKWFYVAVEDGALYIEPGRSHSNACHLKRRTRLSESQFETMLDLYHRRQNGEPVSQEAKANTFHQVYWYGIFADVNL